MSTEAQITIRARLLARLQRILPTLLLSRLMRTLSHSRARWIKRPLISLFMRLYRIDMSAAQIPDAHAYPSLNALFTRALRSGARPLPGADNQLVSPVDGTLGEFGAIQAGRLLQAKGQAYDVTQLLGGRDDLAAAFLGGQFATLYLAPHNYHRVHMPLAGVLRNTCYVPGRLFGVNPASVRAIPRLFTRNERLTALFDTAIGPMAMVLVGAFGVGGIETVWSGEIKPATARKKLHEGFSPEGSHSIELPVGAEMGRFNLGSTVILLFGPGSVHWQPECHNGMTLQVNQALAQVCC